jgi:DNA-3-methyladenine glycosylase II
LTAPSRRKLKVACDTLATADPALARAYAELGIPEWRVGEPSYAALCRLISYQQISTTAAGTIWSRTEAMFGDITPEAVLAADPEDIRACGMSRPKVRHMTSIAEAMMTGRLDLERVCTSDLDAARKELVSVKGIGPWTAELFLLYSVGATDAFPVGDVGLMEAHKLLSEVEIRMEIKEFTAHADRWRPFRGVAAHLLWGWLNDRRAKAAQPSPQA